jgi:monoamine oxidase
MHVLLEFQQFEKQYPGSNVLLVTVTDEESRRIEQQSDNQTRAEAVEVLRKMFPGKQVPDATDILVPRWWSNRFFKGTFSNWPIGVNRYEYDQIRVYIAVQTSSLKSAVLPRLSNRTEISEKIRTKIFEFLTDFE